MKMNFTIDLEDESLSAMFTRSATAGSLENLLEYVLKYGVAVKLMQNGNLLKEFRSPGQLIEYVNNIVASHVKCTKCGHTFQCAPGWINASNTIGCPKCGAEIKLK